MSEENKTPMAQLYTALAAVQGELRDPARTQSGQVRGNRNYKYAGLADVLNSLRPVLHLRGLCFTQGVDVSGDRVVLRTRVFHSGGGEIVSNFPLEWGGSPQDKGSELTYAKRYSLEAMFGITATDDDDADRATRSHHERRSAPEEPPRHLGGRETEEQKKSRQDGHDPSWTKDQAPFMGKLKELGIEYDGEYGVKEFCISKGLSPPSNMDQPMRDRVRKKLETIEGQEAYKAFLAKRRTEVLAAAANEENTPEA